MRTLAVIIKYLMQKMKHRLNYILRGNYQVIKEICEMTKILYQYWFIVLIILLNACKKNDSNELCSGFDDKVYKYNLYQCTEADSIDCYEKRLKSALLPEQYLKCSSTDSLIRTCLTYPFLPVIWAYSTIQIGFEHVTGQFNGFDELYKRVDAIVGLMNVYQEMEPADVYNFAEPADRGAFMSQFTFIELTIAQYQLIDKLTTEETMLLLEISLGKYNSKAAIPTYGFIGEMSTLAIMARILYSQNYEPFMDQLMSIPNLLFFVESAGFMGISNIEEITQFIVSNTEYYFSEEI